jgi:hypothetical protein
VAAEIAVAKAREVPTPDMSTIDLATVLTADDLPEWLQEVARRPASVSRERDIGSISSDAGDREIWTTDRVRPEVQMETSIRPWWAGDRMLAGLLIAIVLTILFVLVTTIRLG